MSANWTRATDDRRVPGGLDAESAEWVGALTGEGPRRDEAVTRLHAMLVRIARAEASRRSGMNGIAGQEQDDLAQQAAGDAVVSVLRKLPEFRGDSRFTTWAYRFVVLEISSKFGRHAWRRDGVRLDGDAWDRLPDRLGGGPAAVVESRELVAAVRTAVEEQLTPHQRRIFLAVVVAGTPLDVLVVELATNRNAIYKTMFDARRKLHRHLVTHGYIENDARGGA